MHRMGRAIPFTGQALVNARRLRKSMTDVERKLWYALRGKRFGAHKFRRQQPIDKYIVDFICMKSRLIIELDGGQHSARQDHDQRRTAALENLGFQVIRFWNSDMIENMDGVLQEIHSRLGGLE